MPYTLLKFLGWGLLLACIGVGIGWALRSLKCRGELTRAAASNVDSDEVERLRIRLADLEPVVAERDRLRIQLADVRHADSPGIVGGDIPAAPSARPAGAADEDATSDERRRNSESEGEPDEGAAVPDTAAQAGDTTVLRLVGRVDDDAEHDDAEHDDAEHDDAEHDDAEHDDVEQDDVEQDDVEQDDVEQDDVEQDDPPALDLEDAAQVIGKKVALDDLTVVEGIGPKICELCSGIGITTWRQLADTDVADLQSMLDAAGSRYAVHKPGTWPRQAALLAAGRWTEFTDVTTELDGGT